MLRTITRLAGVATASYLVVDGLGLATDVQVALIAGLLLVLVVDVLDLFPTPVGNHG